MNFYTTRQIAQECRVSIWLVTRYLRDNYPKHEDGVWWRFSLDEFLSICEVLKAAKIASPKQPLRAVRKPQKALPLS